MNPTRHHSPTVTDLGEFGLIARIQARLARLRHAGPPPQPSPIVGIGDDCAVLPAPAKGRRLLCTCDPVVEGIHYLAGTAPYRVGWKAMARNLSDIAAMGGLPRWATVSLGLRRGTTVAYVMRLYDGLSAAAAKFGCEIVGGDTTHVRGEQFVVVTMLGEVEPGRLALRAGARAGDVVLVTGRLGGSRRGKHLRFIPRVAEARWLVQHAPVHAMIDVSDGLASDLRRLADAGAHHIGFDIDAAAVPIATAARRSLAAALHDGEDFELLFTIAPRHLTALRRRWARTFPLELTPIGRVTSRAGELRLVHRHGAVTVLERGGYDHFGKEVLPAPRQPAAPFR